MEELIDVYFDGKLIKCSSTQTLGAALYANGIHVLGRSIKYRRTRGLFCLTGKCARCVVNVNGIPNIRACTAPLENRMKVRHQKGWPSLNNDLFAIPLSRANFEAGFYYKQGNLEWKFYKELIKRFTGSSSLPGISPSITYGFRKFECDIAILGSGLAGLAAAREAEKWGVSYSIVEQMPWIGGQVALFNSEKYPAFDESVRGGKGEELIEQLRPGKNATIFSNTEAVGFYESTKLLALSNHKEVLELHAKSYVIACGGYGASLSIPNCDLPGIFTYEGALILKNKYGVAPGKRGVIVGTGNLASQVQRELETGGMICEIVHEDEVEGFVGSKVITGISIKRNNHAKVFPADFAVIAKEGLIAYELAVQAGGMLAYDSLTERFKILHDGNLRISATSFVAGSITGESKPGDIFRQGRLAALSALYDLKKSKEVADEREKVRINDR